MNTAVVYYSFSGTTARYAIEKFQHLDADLIEVSEAKKPTLPGAFLKGCPMAMRQAASILRDLPDLSPYDRIVIACPVWAGFPAPAFNAILKLIPSGKSVEIHLVSGSGDTSKAHERIARKIADAGLTLTGYQDIKASAHK